jgi:release factor glutamine methyltransferase
MVTRPPGRPMSRDQIFAFCRVLAVLRRAGLDSAEVDAAEIALGNGADRAVPIGPAEIDKLLDQAGRRATGAPLGYVLRSTRFLGRGFAVDERVLIPRRKTEALAEFATAAASELAGSGFLGRRPLVADVGTGSGVVLISTLLDAPQIDRSYGTDCSLAALEVAGTNAQLHGVGDRVQWLAGDLVEPIPEPVDLLIANLPFLPTPSLPDSFDVTTPEPPEAVFGGGSEGLNTIIRFLESAPAVMRSGGQCLLELPADFVEPMLDLATMSFASVEVYADANGVPRVLSCRR